MTLHNKTEKNSSDKRTSEKNVGAGGGNYDGGHGGYNNRRQNKDVIIPFG